MIFINQKHFLQNLQFPTPPTEEEKGKEKEYLRQEVARLREQLAEVSKKHFLACCCLCLLYSAFKNDFNTCVIEYNHIVGIIQRKCCLTFTLTYILLYQYLNFKKS